MQVNPHTKRRLRLQGVLFYLVFFAVMGLLAWLSTRYSVQADLTAAGRNSLSQASEALLETLNAPVEIRAYVRENPTLRQSLRDLVGRYQRSKADIQLEFVNPDTHPDEVREQGINLEGELLIRYQGRSEKLANPAEQGLTNVLQRLARSQERWVVFLQGHGERRHDGEANHDLGLFVTELERKGIRVQGLNLAATPAIPDNTSTLVIAGPRVALLPGEVALIQAYVEDGGNLLWLLDPEPLRGLEPLADDLGLEPMAGTVVDATTQIFGIEDPAFALVVDYPVHPLTQALNSMTLFPQAVGLELEAPEGWQAEPFLTTLARSWSETGPLEGDIRYEPEQGDRLGPVAIGHTLIRERETGEGQTREQRIALIGDGDFLANSFLGNGANLQLGLDLVNWLAHDDAFINIPPRTAGDRELQLSKTAATVISVGFLILLPLLLLLSGFAIRWRRRSR